MASKVMGSLRGQMALPFPRGRGGARKGAGRPRSAARGSTPHRARPKHRACEPVHVTLRTHSRSLRSQFVFPTVRNTIARTNRRWRGRFRIVHFSVQADHLHFLVEARDARALSGGMRGFSVSFARVFNRLVFRRGRVFPDRWHGRALKTPRAVRHALVYVLANAKKHGEAVGPVDALSSAPYFRGFREFRGRVAFELQPRLVPRFAQMRGKEAEFFELLEAPRSWLLRAGWKWREPISVHEVPRRLHRPNAPEPRRARRPRTAGA